MVEKSLQNRPFFSIVMPVYNVMKYLEESIGSVLSQTFPDFELIMVDDGSTDDCGAVCDKYAGLDSRCRMLRHEVNRGLLAARRTGIAAAKGEYLVNIDSDDMLRPSALETLRKIIEFDSPDMIIFNFSNITDDGVITSHKPLFEDEVTRPDKKWLLETFASGPKVNSIWGKCTRLSKVDTDDDYSEFGRLNMAEDELQSTALFSRCDSFIYYSRPIYLYRSNRQGITKMRNPQIGLDSIRAKSRVPEMLRTCGAEKSIFRTFFRIYYHTVNVYLLRNVGAFDSFEAYKKYRDEMKKYDVGGLNDAGTVDRIVYSILFSGSFRAARLLGRLYRKSKNI